nr:DUF4011 domain-containing protein [Treponemataceae bacterium]
ESDYSKQVLNSPLILVPVSLEQESIKSPIVLKATEDEIVINPTLSYKLSHDFKISLPEFEEYDFPLVLQKLRGFAKENGWVFKDEICLSILSFLKINMYKDLERHKDSIMNHPLINDFAGNFSFNKKELESMMQTADSITDFNHDSVKPQEVFQIVDADSSQQDAILCADKGVSFVLQGPPGTGKSQTITNIIASKLADGKKVLFVSEKKAALEVVYKRLKESGLSDFILTLHNNKANKKETLSQLENVLALSRKNISLDDSVQHELKKLEKDRDNLNTYAKQVNEPIAPLNKSIFFANGIISKFSDAEDISFSIPSIRETTEDQFREYIETLGLVASKIKEMNDDCSTNPWRNNIVQYMTNEFIHDLGEKKNNIVAATEKIHAAYKRLEAELGISAESLDIQSTEKIIALLKKAFASPVVPKIWLDENTEETQKYIFEQKNFKNVYSSIVDYLPQLFEKLQIANTAWNYKTTDLTSISEAKLLAETLETIVDGDSCYHNLKNDINTLSFILTNEEIVNNYNTISNTISSEYNKDIFSIDFKSMEIRYKYNYNSVFKVFNSSYRKDKKLLKQLLLNPKNKKTQADIILLLENLNKRQELKETIENQKTRMTILFPLIYKMENTDFSLIHKEIEKYNLLKDCTAQCKQILTILMHVNNKKELLSHLFENRFQGISTDWNEIENSMNWFKDFTSSCKSTNESELGISIAQNFVVQSCTNDNYKTAVESNLSAIESLYNQSKNDFEWFAAKFENQTEILSKSFDSIKERIVSCAENMHNLEIWIDYRAVREKASAIGLSDFLQIIENKPILNKEIIAIFEKRFFRLWLDSVFPEYPAVAKFRHTTQEKLIEDFSELDKKQLKIAQLRIKEKIINSLPPLDTFTSGEVNILKRELSKQRKIMPIRKLFNKIPNLLMTLKPCLMMSPLSVSQFLESDCYQFDTVIFDEASQVKTENAIGAISRGKQVIIAGDSKQLPPTNFFEVATSDSEFDTEDDDRNELLDTSILEEALFLPSKELLWHYRSRHEHLIAFSNSTIYKDRLVTFPSNKEEMPDWGVEYIYVENGIYTNKGNLCEAERVADEVFKHIKNHPDRTLGVITFGIVQEVAIESAINKRRQANPQYEDFFKEDRHEAFFVKNLENVQGDERDTIIFSIGYAKDNAGKMAMRFGPLGMVGGERRLNVAITRAKYNIKLIGSILPTDIDTDKISNEGPKLLRKYIEFARNGIKVLQNEIKFSNELQFDSPFEQSVYNFLDSQKYKVSTQVGCSGFRIDMAVKHPTLSGVFVIGIECDGATYHSSRTARERDRLRQDVLEMMGWKIHRIWSTDWIKNTAEEKKRLLKAVANAIETYRADLEIEKKHFTQLNEQNIEISEMYSISDKPFNTDNYKFAEYKEYDISRHPFTLSSTLLEMIKTEQPVHFDIICQRLCPLYGRDKVTSTVQKEIRKALRFNSLFLCEDGFYSLAQSENSFDVRVAGSRQIKYISLDEISKGMLKIIENNIGLTENELVTETEHAFGFKRTGTNLENRMRESIALLKQANKITINGGKIIVNDANKNTPSAKQEEF